MDFPEDLHYIKVIKNNNRKHARMISGGAPVTFSHGVLGNELL